jgi:hypothetical protein
VKTCCMLKIIEALYCTQIGVSRNKMHFYAIRCKIFLRMRSRSGLDVLDDEERRDKECGIAEARHRGITAPQHRCTAAASLIWQPGPATCSATNGGVKPGWHPKKIAKIPALPLLAIEP